ncbi:MAG: hypothetical protein QOH01_394 [Verrucomicrobiota bacterium]|jgi:hypothetical protein
MSPKALIWLVALTVASMLCPAQDNTKQSERRIWGTSYMRELAPDGKVTRIALDDVSQGVEHLLGGVVLSRQVEGPIPQLMIKGHFNKKGEFAPNVSLEVSNQRDGSWKTVESSLSETVDIMLTGGPHIDKLFTVIQLDALQPYIGRFEFCRITLQTGESDIFPMVWLTEQGESEQANADRSVNPIDSRFAAEPTQRSKPVSDRTSDGSVPVAFRSPSPP